MITRIVKMEIEANQMNLFVKIFEQHAIKMKTVEGCMTMELVKDIFTPTTVFTISVWQGEKALDTYRTSQLFNLIWSELKPLFCAKPAAWTTQSLYHARH